MLPVRPVAKTSAGNSDNRILIVGCVIFGLILLLPEPGMPSVYFNVLEGASSALKGYVTGSDINQDLIGAQGLLLRHDPYPILGAGVGVGHASTHPPTAFLLVLPIARLPQSWALAIWAWLMLSLLVITLRCYGASWKAALGLTPIVLLWTPIQMSLGQITIVWLCGVAVAYRFRQKRPFLSGVSLGLASLTKFLPGLLIVAFLLKKQWRALAGFIGLWLVTLAVLIVLFPGTLDRYLEVNRTTSLAIVQRADNSALLVNSYRVGGWLGVGLIGLFLFSIIVVNRDSVLNRQSDIAPGFWRILMYFSVALLPIAWTYSIVPLLPVIVYQVIQRKLLIRVAGLCCLVLPCLAPPWGDLSILPLMLVMILTGAGLLVDALPFRIFTATSLADLKLLPNSA